MPDTTFIPTGLAQPGSDDGAGWESIASLLGTALDSMNLGHLATAGAIERGFADDPALVWYAADGTVVRATYRDLESASAKSAGAFQAAGLLPGDRVLFLLPTLPELFYAVLGALRIGAVVSVVPPNRNADAVKHILAHGRPRFILTLPAFKNLIMSLKPVLEDLERVFYVNRTTFTLPALADYESEWGAVFEAAPAIVPTGPTGAKDPAILHFTEIGQTASVVMHEAALGLARTARSALGWQPREAVTLALVPGEPAYVSYMLLAPFLVGSLVICHEDPARFTRHADVAVDLSPRSWFSSFKALDVMIRTEPNLGTLLKGCASIAVVHPADRGFLSMSALSWGGPVRTVWIPWECGLILASDGGNRAGSAGQPVQGAEVRILSETGSRAATGEIGAVAVKLGPGAPFLEYWSDETLTLSRVRDGWFLSPQRGSCDADGFLWIEG